VADSEDWIMKVAQVAPLYESVPPKLYGGTERVVSYLTEELVRMGHDVTLFASGDSLTSARLVPGCEESLRLDSKFVDRLAHHILILQRVFAAKDEFDIIHFHVDYLHFPLTRRERAVTVTTLHGRLDLPDLQPLYQEFNDMPVISISDSQRKPLPCADWKGTVYHGIPLNSYEFGNGRQGYLAFLGRIAPEKGLDEAIRISQLTGIPLKVAAKIDQVDEQYYANTIRPLLDNPLVEFIGEIGHADKGQFLGNAMALLFPIDWPEPFGLVMIEAMACGTPVVAYPRGSVPEIIEDGVTGFLVANAEEAAQAIGKIAQIDRRTCRLQFEQRFTATRMAADYVNLYRQLLRGESRNVTVDDGVPVG
jgi:glycosyltransferase involved in cell wall biosynthesis